MTVRLPSLPAPGQTVLGSTFSTTPGGKGANQAVAARRAGAEVVFVTAVGADALGGQSLDLYRREGIDVSHVRVVEGATSGVALIFVGDDGENVIGVAPGANQRLGPDDVDQLPESLFRDDGVMLLAGLEIPVETAVRAAERGSRAGMVVVLNPAPAPSLGETEARSLLSRADVVTPNRLEAMTLSGMGLDPGAEADWKSCADRLIAMGAKAAVITLGSGGCLVVSGDRASSIGAPRVEAIDTVGAGDAFNGALAVALSERRPLAEATAWAVAAAALAVTRPGAQAALPAREAIDRMVAEVGPR